MTVPGQVAKLIDTAMAALEGDRETARLLLRRASALLRTDLMREEVGATAPLRGAMAAWQLRRLMVYIESHLTVPITAEQLAEEIGSSVGRMFRGFKASTGMTPFRYIAIRRVDLARELMRTSDEPLSQIALACGLFDQSHFCRLFRRVMGQRPNDWRRMNAPGPAYSHSVSAHAHSM